MSEHPPLCPKEPNFWSINDGVDVFSQIGYSSISPAVRKFVARYQACAWQDRAARWWDVWRRNDDFKGHAHRQFSWHRFATDCEKVAKAWREWEKLP